MEDSLQETQHVQTHVNSITKRFAADTEWPLNGSIHLAFRCAPEVPTPLNAGPEVAADVALNIVIQDRLLNQYVLFTSYLMLRLNTSCFYIIY